jgi:hypothetical protein
MRVISLSYGWLDNGDVFVDHQSLFDLLWRNIEQGLGRRQDLPGTRQRCRSFDTQEVRFIILSVKMKQSDWPSSLSELAGVFCIRPALERNCPL